MYCAFKNSAEELNGRNKVYHMRSGKAAEADIVYY